MLNEDVKNLNLCLINDRDRDPERLIDPSIETTNCSVFFRNLTDRLIGFIDEAECVVGCVAWLTNKRILDALARKRGVSIVVQKEDFLRPDLDSLANWKAELNARYKRLSTVDRRHLGEAEKLSFCGGNQEEAVRCVGVVSKDRASPRCHHKFVVFCKHTQIGYEIDVVPYAVWTGSFNFTWNAEQSLENAVVLRHPEIVQAYYREFQQILALSEELDWSASSYVNAQWRIGS